jgi:hypothetical protein
MAGDEGRQWVPKLEIEEAQVKWGFSHFDGRADTFNDEGDHNFTLVLPAEEARRLQEEGWNVKEFEPSEERRKEGYESEFTLKVNISYRFDPPMIYFIKSGRKIRVDQDDLRDIRRDTCERIDVVIKPSFWTRPDRSGITAFVDEMFVTIAQSRFADRYADLEEVKPSNI